MQQDKLDILAPVPVPVVLMTLRREEQVSQVQAIIHSFVSTMLVVQEDMNRFVKVYVQKTNHNYMSILSKVV